MRFSVSSILRGSGARVVAAGQVCDPSKLDFLLTGKLETELFSGELDELGRIKAPLWMYNPWKPTART